MELVTGQEVFLAFATERSSTDGQPFASVRKAIVIDAENRVLKREGGTVQVLHDYSVEEAHPTEAAAWAACAAKLTERAYAVRQKADNCHARAAEAAAAERIVQVPA